MDLDELQRAANTANQTVRGVTGGYLVNFRRVWKIAKSVYQLRHVRPTDRPSVRMEQLEPHWTVFHEI